METLYYKTLITVAELGSFSLAAQRLHITQSTTSRRIAALEEHYEQILLDREGTTILPTPAGQLVIDKARHILSTEDQIGEELARLDVPTRIALGCTPNFSATHLSRVLTHLGKLGVSPHLTVSTGVTDDLVSGIECGSYDVVFLEHCGLPAIENLPARELPEDRVVFLSAQADIPAGSVDINALLSEQLFVCPACCCTRQLLDANLRAVDLDVTNFAKVIDLGDIHVMRQTLLEQGGVAFLSTDLIAKELAAGLLTAHVVPEFTHHRRRTIVARDATMADTWHALYEAATVK